MVTIHQVHTHWVRFALALIVLVCFSVSIPAAELDEYSVFIGGFTAFQNQDYQGAATKMSQFLKEYPSTPLRDMALFWLARAHFRLGEKKEAARYMAQFLKENPDTPLRNAAEPELIALAQSYDEKGIAGIAALDKKQAAGAIEKKLVVAAAPSTLTPAEVSGKSQMAVGEPQVHDKVAPTTVSRAPREEQPPTLREKAIQEYRTVQEKFPGTKAASIATERLKELEKVAFSPEGKSDRTAEMTRGADKPTVISLEVGQFAAADLSVHPAKESTEVGSTISIPFEVVNRGNGPDSFVLEDGFPAEYKARIVSLAHPDSSVAATPQLASGESFSGKIILTVPSTIIDGQRNTYPLRLVSRFDGDASLSKEIPLLFSAPLLRMVVLPDKPAVLPGDVVTYRIALFNVGSASARKISFTLDYPGNYEPVESLPAGFRRDGTGRFVVEGLELLSGGRKEFSIPFRLKEDALAGQELFCRAELHNSTLNLSESFLSSAVVVGKVAGVTVTVQNKRRTVLPGEKIIVPVNVINTGNFRESLVIKTSIPAGMRHAIYKVAGSSDNQTDELITDAIVALSPREEAALKVELFAPSAITDNSQASVTISVAPVSAPEKSAAATVQLVFARPVITLGMEASAGVLRPGKIAHLVVTIVNSGSSMAKDVEVKSYLPERIEVVASEPGSIDGANGEYAWRFSAVGPGEKRSIVLAYRVKPGVAAGTNLQIKNSFSYKDQLGNSY
jgi:outer membrane protein assembly factor BamD (BamD/ComL family)